MAAKRKGPAETTPANVGVRKGEKDTKQREQQVFVQSVIRRLEELLLQIRSRLGFTIEQHETTVQELKAANDELQAINEELRTATRELETGKGEIQSVNEELTIANHKLERFSELSVAREVRMVELKREVNSLLEELGRKKRHPLKFEEEEAE